MLSHRLLSITSGAVALSQALDFPEAQWPDGDLLSEVLDDL
jgi:hypothetical protein